jgi:hypothetical protein
VAELISVFRSLTLSPLRHFLSSDIPFSVFVDPTPSTPKDDGAPSSIIALLPLCHRWAPNGGLSFILHSRHGGNEVISVISFSHCFFFTSTIDANNSHAPPPLLAKQESKCRDWEGKIGHQNVIPGSLSFSITNTLHSYCA